MKIQKRLQRGLIKKCFLKTHHELVLNKKRLMNIANGKSKNKGVIANKDDTIQSN